MGKRAPHISVDLDDVHSSPFTWATDLMVALVVRLLGSLLEANAEVLKSQGGKGSPRGPAWHSRRCPATAGEIKGPPPQPTHRRGRVADHHRSGPTKARDFPAIGSQLFADVPSCQHGRSGGRPPRADGPITHRRAQACLRLPRTVRGPPRMTTRLVVKSSDGDQLGILA